jgi:hypothetical protein
MTRSRQSFAPSRKKGGHADAGSPRTAAGPESRPSRNSSRYSISSEAGRREFGAQEREIQEQAIQARAYFLSTMVLSVWMSLSGRRGLLMNSAAGTRGVARLVRSGSCRSTRSRNQARPY